MIGFTLHGLIAVQTTPPTFPPLNNLNTNILFGLNRFWRRMLEPISVLVTTNRCWWRIWALWLTFKICHQHRNSVTNIHKSSPTLSNQHKLCYITKSPTSPLLIFRADYDMLIAYGGVPNYKTEVKWKRFITWLHMHVNSIIKHPNSSKTQL